MDRGVSAFRPAYDPDALVTAAEAAASPHLHGVSRQLIGMWRHLGKLTVKGKRGRSPLYRYGDILRVERDTRRSGYSHRRTAELDTRRKTQRSHRRLAA